MTSSTIRFLLCIFCVALFCISCTSNRPKPAPEVIFRLKTHQELNPDANGRPSPIVLRVYALREVAAFNNARFFELWENTEQALGDDLVSFQEVEMFPSQSIELEIENTSPDTIAVGILAGYRFLERSNWREVYLIDDERNTTYLNVNVDEYRLRYSEGHKKDRFVAR